MEQRVKQATRHDTDNLPAILLLGRGLGLHHAALPASHPVVVVVGCGKERSVSDIEMQCVRTENDDAADDDDACLCLLLGEGPMQKPQPLARKAQHNTDRARAQLLARLVYKESWLWHTRSNETQASMRACLAHIIADFPDGATPLLGLTG